MSKETLPREAHRGGQDDETDGSAPTSVDGTLAYIRALTAPPLVAPLASELNDALIEPWSCRNVRLPIPVASDTITTLHWKSQPKDPMCQSMLDFTSSPAQQQQPVMHLQPYLSWGDPFSIVFLPHLDFVHCLKHLLLNTVGSHSTCDNSTVLVSHNRPIFVSTAPYFQEGFFQKNVLLDQKEKEGDAYVLRCHFDNSQNCLVIGYHSFTDPECFHRLHHVSMEDQDWRLKASLILTNTARILNCLKDYTIPLKQWHDNDRLSIVCRSDFDGRVEECVQKIYTSPTICGIFGATVESMIGIYKALEKAHVPHTDRLLSVDVVDQDNKGTTTICKFGPIGRCYLPVNTQELLDALGCVTKALLVMHSHQIMHRDIRWANVFHALQEGKQQFTREWILFDFEFAAIAPQPAFGEHTLTPGNHAPEMITPHHDQESTDDETNTDSKAKMHDTAVDIWGLGYLIQNAYVDLPASHASDLARLQDHCLQEDPSLRPSTRECFEIIHKLQARPLSREKNVV